MINDYNYIQSIVYRRQKYTYIYREIEKEQTKDEWKAKQ